VCFLTVSAQTGDADRDAQRELFEHDATRRMLGHADVKQTATYLNAERVGLHESMKQFGTAPGWESVAIEAAEEHTVFWPRPRRHSAARDC